MCLIAFSQQINTAVLVLVVTLWHLHHPMYINQQTKSYWTAFKPPQYSLIDIRSNKEAHVFEIQQTSTSGIFQITSKVHKMAQPPAS